MLYRVLSLGPLGVERCEFASNDRRVALIALDILLDQRADAGVTWLEWWPDEKPGC